MINIYSHDWLTHLLDQDIKYGGVGMHSAVINVEHPKWAENSLYVSLNRTYLLLCFNRVFFCYSSVAFNLGCFLPS